MRPPLIRRSAYGGENGNAKANGVSPSRHLVAHPPEENQNTPWPVTFRSSPKTLETYGRRPKLWRINMRHRLGDRHQSAEASLVFNTRPQTDFQDVQIDGQWPILPSFSSFSSILRFSDSTRVGILSLLKHSILS